VKKNTTREEEPSAANRAVEELPARVWEKGLDRFRAPIVGPKKFVVLSGAKDLLFC
jgi:hypothetical protein